MGTVTWWAIILLRRRTVWNFTMMGVTMGSATMTPSQRRSMWNPSWPSISRLMRYNQTLVWIPRVRMFLTATATGLRGTPSK